MKNKIIDILVIVLLIMACKTTSHKKVTLKVENKKIPEMGLNVWIFKYTHKNTPKKGIKYGLLICSNTDQEPIQISESKIQIFVNKKYKILFTNIKKEQADSIVQKIFKK